jgi:hypothetical protein
MDKQEKINHIKEDFEERGIDLAFHEFVTLPKGKRKEVLNQNPHPEEETEQT